ncbi:MAG: MBL fold metallo-hydrolase [Gammaproteobacteria bacterium]|nr:MBL fold metallo-hydrolase [Gammaproteobacteria bacterium]
MDVRCYGAAGEVTGSCFLVSAGGRRILVDCGLIQGRPADERRNREPFPFEPAALDAVVLTHAHIDHSGRLPLLMTRGYDGPVYTHRATVELCAVLLQDAAHLAGKDAEWENRKRERKGLQPVEPLYTVADAQRTQRLFRQLDYDTPREILPGIVLTLRDAGHILGSASAELAITDGERTRRIVFSGDIGHSGAPILRDPAPVPRADLVVMESTYGDRLHRPWEDTWRELGTIIGNAASRKGNILIPAFAVGRTQELLYVFGRHFDAWHLGGWHLYLDSPMAIEATDIYARHEQVHDAPARAWSDRHGSLFRLPNLRISRTGEQSMAINRVRSGAIIIAGSGMCNGGRIRHHLKHNVWRPETQVVIVGYQAAGTVGRALVDGARYIRLWGEAIKVNATIHTVGGLSAHADQAGLLAWYGAIAGRPPVVLVHGEAGPMRELATRLQRDLGARVTQARYGESVTP